MFIERSPTIVQAPFEEAENKRTLFDSRSPPLLRAEPVVGDARIYKHFTSNGVKKVGGGNCNQVLAKAGLLIAAFVHFCHDCVRKKRNRFTQNGGIMRFSEQPFHRATRHMS